MNTKWKCMGWSSKVLSNESFPNCAWKQQSLNNNKITISTGIEVLSKIHISFKNVPVLVIKLAYCLALVYTVVYKVAHILKISFEKL